ncbi:MAG: hypothetical protein ACXVEX_04050 [Actinomycetota bacterium]
MTLATWFAASVALVLGAGMLGLWAMLLVTKQVPELRRRDRAIYFHIAAETFTAVLLIFGSGAAITTDGAPWTVGLLAAGFGALLYSTINSPGYYAQQRKWGAVAMFGGLFVLAAAGLVAALSSL